MLKKIGSFLLIAVMLMAVLTPLTIVAAASGQCGDNLFWKLDDSGILTISGTGKMWSWTFSSQAPWESTYVKNVVINYGVTSIGNRAFFYCDSLTSISIPNSVTSIGNSAFSLCYSLTSINIPSSVTSIGYLAFDYCRSLTSISIPSSVTSIGDNAFSYCESLTSISIPSSVTSIGDGTFTYCESLVAILVNSSNTEYSNDEYGVLFNKNKTKIIRYPNGRKETTYTIPSSVTSIGNNAFSGCDSLTSISIPDSVTSIGDEAFYDCESLASIIIPSNVTSIEETAFLNCTSLTSILVDSRNTKYTNDEYGVLFDKNKTKIIQYPNGRKETTYTIPSSVTSIGNNAFGYCESLTSINIPRSVTSIGKFAFFGCAGLTSIIIPSGVTSIGNYAFSACKSLTSISIPSGVTSIGDYAFLGCESLTDIYYAGSEAMWKTLAKNASVPQKTKVHYYSVAPGTVTGSALRTDIIAEINGHIIPSFNVDGYTYIVAEDLKDYGFSVYYDNATRTLALSRDTAKTDITRSYIKPYVAPGEVGIKEHDLVATDIVTYLDNNYVASFNINGQTIIKFDELGRYGAVSFDNSTRIISVTIPGLN